MRRWIIAIGMALCLVWSPGCAPTIEFITEATVEPAVGAGLEELTEEENKERLNELLELEGMEKTGEHLGRGLTLGALTATGEFAEELAEMDLEGQAASLLQIVAWQMEEEVGPALEVVAASMTRAVLEEIGSPQNRARTAALAVEVTDAVMMAIAAGLRGELGPAVREMLVDDVGPALEVVLEEHIGPGITAMLDDKFNAAIGETARVISREVTIGVSEGLDEIEDIEPEDESLVEVLARNIVAAADALGWIFWVLVVAGMALVVVLIGWATRLMFQARDVKKKSDLREESIVRLAEALKRVERGGGESQELYSQVSRQMEDED